MRFELFLEKHVGQIQITEVNTRIIERNSRYTRSQRDC